MQRINWIFVIVNKAEKGIDGMKKVRKYWWRNDRNAASEVSGKP